MPGAGPHEFLCLTFCGPKPRASRNVSLHLRAMAVEADSWNRHQGDTL